MTIRPLPFARWIVPLLLIAVGALFVWAAFHDPTATGLGDRWPGIALAAIAVAIAVLGWSVYIQINDSEITAGTLVTARRYDRRAVARIVASRSPATKLTRFVRSDGSVIFVTSGYIWGYDRMKLIADYLGVPLDW